jgi:hypothetical protein
MPATPAGTSKLETCNRHQAIIKDRNSSFKLTGKVGNHLTTKLLGKGRIK